MRSVSWQALATAVSAAAGFAYSLLVAKTLGADAFGAMSIALAIGTVVFQLVELRLHEAVVKFLVEYHEARDEAGARELLRYSFFADAASGVLAFLLTLLVAWIGRSLTKTAWPELRVVALAAAYLLAWNSASSTAQGILRALDRVKHLSIVTVVQSISRLGLTAVAVLVLGWSTEGVLFVAAVVAGAANAATVLAARAAVKRSFTGGPPEKTLARPRERLREIYAFVRNAYIINVTQLPLKDLDVALLGALVPHATVGAYRVAKNFFVAANLVFDPVYYAMYPEMARLWARGSRAELVALLRKAVRILGALAIAICVGGAIVVPWFIRTFFQHRYDGAIAPFYAMLLGVLLWGPFVWVPGVLFAAGRSDLSLRAALVGTGVILASYAVFLPTLGVVGAAITIGPGAAIGNLVALSFVRSAGILRIKDSAGRFDK